MNEFTISHLAWLSRLEIREEEVRELEKRLNALKKLIDRIIGLELRDVEPLYHPLESEGKLREDTPSKGLDRETALTNAARVENGYVVAPRTVED
jgi:aspartyl-tRNA(Asn)/glutamyl-tRNA(Gln) amidotransferase subunit C